MHTDPETKELEKQKSIKKTKPKPSSDGAKDDEKQVESKSKSQPMIKKSKKAKDKVTLDSKFGSP